MKKMIVLACTVSCLLGGVAMPAQATNGTLQAVSGPRSDQLPELIRASEKGVVFIRMLGSGGQLVSSGTGFLIDDKGTVLTCLHVLLPKAGVPASAETIAVNGKIAPVKGVLASDESLDLALLQLAEMPEGTAPLPIGGGGLPQQGEYVIVLGHPQGFRFVATDGIVSAIHRTRELPDSVRNCECVRAGPDVAWLQTSAAIFYGNSGGPMLDSSGRVIGVIQWLAGGQGMNFALHIGTATNLLAGPRTLVSVADLSRPHTELRKAINGFQTAYWAYWEQADPGRGGSSSRQARQIPVHPAIANIPKMLEIAEANRGKGVEYRALEAVMKVASSYGCPTNVADEVSRASARLIAEFRDDRRLRSLLLGNYRPAMPEARAFLRELAAKSSDADIRALAALDLAQALGSDHDNKASQDEAIRLARSAAGCNASLMIGREYVSVMASNLAERLEIFSIGTPAPALAGTDQSGTPLNLKDLQGQYVVVAFWTKSGDFFDTTSKFLETIAMDYAGAPLAIVGVTLNDRWHSTFTGFGQKTNDLIRIITDDGDGVIKKAWQITAIPTAFLIDRTGHIAGYYFDEPRTSALNFGAEFSASFNSRMNVGEWASRLTNALEKIPAISGPRRELTDLATGGPWIAMSDWDPASPGDRTVFLRADGRTSVSWISGWHLHSPNVLHLYLPRGGWVRLNMDADTGEATVVAPSNLVMRTMKRRDLHPSAEETDAARRTRELLLAEKWDWFDTGKAGVELPAATVQFMSNQTSSVSWLPAWEILPSGQVRVYRNTGAYWTFDVEHAAKRARSNLADSQIKDDKAFATGESARRRVLDLSQTSAVCTGRFERGTAWQEVRFTPSMGRYVCIEALSSEANDVWTSAAEIELLRPDGSSIDRRGWSIAYVSSEERQGEDGSARNVLDGWPTTIWHTQWFYVKPAHPHYLVLDLGREEEVAGLRILPRQESSHGRIKDFRGYVSRTAFL